MWFFTDDVEKASFRLGFDFKPLNGSLKIEGRLLWNDSGRAVGREPWKYKLKWLENLQQVGDDWPDKPDLGSNLCDFLRERFFEAPESARVDIEPTSLARALPTQSLGEQKNSP